MVAMGSGTADVHHVPGYATLKKGADYKLQYLNANKLAISASNVKAKGTYYVVVVGTGMGPVYPAIQHMAPANFGRKYSAAVIGLQMASAYIGSTLMPMVFGHIQQAVGIAVREQPLSASRHGIVVSAVEVQRHARDRGGDS